MTNEEKLAYVVGMFFLRKYTQRVEEGGIYKAALQLRKQGVPLEVARLILLGGA